NVCRSDACTAPMTKVTFVSAALIAAAVFTTRAMAARSDVAARHATTNASTMLRPHRGRRQMIDYNIFRDQMTIRRLRLGAGLIMLSYLALHLSMHALDNVSFEAMQWGTRIHDFTWHSMWLPTRRVRHRRGDCRRRNERVSCARGNRARPCG